MRTFTAVALCLLTIPLQAEASHLLLASGSVCQPTSPADGRYIHYLDGGVTADKPVTVTCPLPVVMSGWGQISAAVSYYDGYASAWDSIECTFHQFWSWESVTVPVRNVDGVGVHFAQAEFLAEKAGFTAASAVCTLLPGQTLKYVSNWVQPVEPEWVEPEE